MSHSKSNIKSFYLNKAKKKSSISTKDKQSIRIAVYRRVSTQEQANDGQSITAQKQRISKFIENDVAFEGFDTDIIDFCDNGYSGKDFNRPSMQKMLNQMLRGQLDYIVVIKLDRLSRNLPEMYSFMELCNKHDIGFISINEKIDTKTAHGRFFIGILASLSQLEREQTSERVQGVFKELIHKQPLGGKPPFGFFYYKPDTSKPGQYLPYDQENAEKVKLPPIKTQNSKKIIYPADFVPKMFRWYSKWKNFRKIALKLTELGIPTSNQIHRSVRFYFSKQQSSNGTSPDFLLINTVKKWNPRSVKDILTNPFYTGTRVWNRKDNLNKRIRNYDEWIYIENTHESLIDFSTFRNVEELIFN